MAESTSVHNEEILTETSTAKADNTPSENEVEEKRPSIPKVEDMRTSISKDGSRKLSIAKSTDSKKSISSQKDVEGKDLSTAKEFETEIRKGSIVEGAEPLAVSLSTGEHKEADELPGEEDKVGADFDEVEEEYEEEVEEDGEIKTVTKKRIVKVPKQREDKIEGNLEEDELEEEYQIEVEEDGVIKTITKKRKVRVPKSTIKDEVFKDGTGEEDKEDEKDEELKERKILIFEEKTEEYESEEEDENGELVLVKKTRVVRVPVRSTTTITSKFEEVVEDYEEEVEDEDGQKVIVKQKRVVKIRRLDSSKPSEEIIPIDEKEEEKLEEEGEVEEEEEEVDEEEEEEVEEEEDVEVAEGKEEVEEGGLKTREVKKRRRRKDAEKAEEGGEITDEKKKKKRRRKKKKRKSVEKGSVVPSEEDKKDEEEREEAEEVSVEGEKEEVSAKKSLTSAELRLAEEKVVMAQQFENLTKLRCEHLALRKRTLFLTSKLIQYFRKQKMDHLYMDIREDPEAEQRFLRKLVEFHEYNQHVTEERARINTEWEAQRTVNEELDAEMKQTFDDLMTLKREVAAKLIDARTGRTIQHDKALEDLLIRQEQQMKRLSECRLIKIKLKRRIEMKKAEGQMDSTSGDFRLMDYEKLASLKDYYTDKITERDIEIGEVKNKIGMMDDNLSGIKDQLKRREEEMEQEQMKLQLITTDLNARRENLSRIKTTKHKTERNTMKIKQQSGLLAYPILLKDYEEKSRQLEELKSQTERMKQQYRAGLERIHKLKETVKKRTEAKYSSPSSLSST